MGCHESGPAEDAEGVTAAAPGQWPLDLIAWYAASAVPLTLVVLLFLEPGRQPEFERFETAAAGVMARHGGRLERRIRFSTVEGPAQPDELHVVTFPDAASFDRYRTDPEIQALRDLRERAIRRTVIWSGDEAVPFGA